MSDPYNYEDSMRIHDAAIYSWLDGLLVDYGTINGEARNQVPILKVFAAPHRAFAQAYDLLVKMGWAAGGNDETARLTAEADWAVLPLPICTIDRDYPVFSPQLSASALTYERTFRDPVTGDWVTLPYPLHAFTTYRLTFWCLKRYTEAYILEWFYTRFGQRGAGNREVYLTVHHQAPFGDQMQALRWIGTGDQSELEGDNPRYIRMNATVMFRTWFMRDRWPAARREPPVHAIQREAYAAEDMLATSSWWGTGNLWTIRDPSDANSLATWPRWGDASVASNSGRGLDVTLTGGLDRVELIELGNIVTTDDYQILSISGSVSPTAPATLFIDEFFGDPIPRVAPVIPQVYPPPTPLPINSSFGAVMLTPEFGGALRLGTRVWEQSTGSEDASFHEFTLSRGKRFMYGVEGGPAGVGMSRIDVRQVFDALKTPPTQVDSWPGYGDPESVYRWQNLDIRPYLIVVRLVNPTVPGTVLTFEDDDTAPTFSRPRTVSTIHTLGLVALVQPKLGNLRVRVPSTVIVADAYVRPFDGPYLGGTLLP